MDEYLEYGIQVNAIELYFPMVQCYCGFVVVLTLQYV